MIMKKINPNQIANLSQFKLITLDIYSNVKNAKSCVG